MDFTDDKEEVWYWPAINDLIIFTKEWIKYDHSPGKWKYTSSEHTGFLCDMWGPVWGQYTIPLKPSKEMVYLGDI